MDTNVKQLLNIPVWQMTGEQQYRLIQFALGNATPNAASNSTMAPDSPFAPKRTRIAGVHALALYLECCDSLVYKLRREGVLDEAIISRIGKKIVFDGEIARRCANEYQEQQRTLRSDNR
jgi:hypothetical protein